MKLRIKKNIPYASTVRSLMCAQVCTCLDIAFIVGMLGKYISNPEMVHWKVAKRVKRFHAHISEI